MYFIVGKTYFTEIDFAYSKVNFAESTVDLTLNNLIPKLKLNPVPKPKLKPIRKPKLNPVLKPKFNPVPNLKLNPVSNP